MQPAPCRSQKSHWQKIRTMVNLPVISPFKRRYSWVQLAGHTGESRGREGGPEQAGHPSDRHPDTLTTDSARRELQGGGHQRADPKAQLGARAFVPGATDGRRAAGLRAGLPRRGGARRRALPAAAGPAARLRRALRPRLQDGRQVGRAGRAGRRPPPGSGGGGCPPEEVRPVPVPVPVPAGPTWRRS